MRSPGQLTVFRLHIIFVKNKASILSDLTPNNSDEFPHPTLQHLGRGVIFGSKAGMFARDPIEAGWELIAACTLDGQLRQVLLS